MHRLTPLRSFAKWIYAENDFLQIRSKQDRILFYTVALRIQQCLKSRYNIFIFRSFI